MNETVKLTEAERLEYEAIHCDAIARSWLVDATRRLKLRYRAEECRRQAAALRNKEHG